MKRKKCTCSNKKGTQVCKNCSSYKMVFLLKNGNDHLKYSYGFGKLVNPVQWSFIKEDHLPQNKVFANMLNRAREKGTLYLASTVINFYDRAGNFLDSFIPV